MDRRRFLLALAAGLAGTAGLRGAAGLGDAVGPPAEPAPPAVAWQAVGPRGVPGLVPVPPALGVVEALPGEGVGLALSIDDGTSSEVVAAFAAFAVDTGVRLTLFPNGRYRSWAENAAVLAPLAESGQVAFLAAFDQQLHSQTNAEHRDFIFESLAIENWR